MTDPRTLDQFDVSGRSALVTGAASGIGLAYAECMAEAGAKVTLTDIDAEGAEREAARLCAEGYEARADVCDVADLVQVAAAVDKHVAAYGGLDICFANAGLDVERDVLPGRLPGPRDLQHHETIVEPDDRIDGPRPLETQPGLHDRTYRVAKAGDYDVLGLIHDVTARIDQGDHHENPNRDSQ